MCGLMKSVRAASDLDRVLIRRCQQGNAVAWQQVLNKYERLVYSIPLRYGLSRDDAADIAQNTFTILIESLDTLSEDSCLGAWLATVSRRHSWRLLERNRREVASEGLDATDLVERAVLLGKGNADSIEHWELNDLLDTGISQIGESCRELLLALYFQPELSSYAEVAERLDMPLGS